MHRTIVAMYTMTRFLFSSNILTAAQQPTIAPLIRNK